jgi:hypothetical protein
MLLLPALVQFEVSASSERHARCRDAFQNGRDLQQVAQFRPLFLLAGSVPHKRHTRSVMP